jgi:hypothetical protein
MKRTAIVILITMLHAVSVMADSPAVGYWLVATRSLTNAVNQAGELSKVDQTVLDSTAECRGHFNGPCDLVFQAGTAQFRIKATDDGATIDYTVVYFWPQVKVAARESHGCVKVGHDLVAKVGWEKDAFVLVMKRLNLKQ